MPIENQDDKSVEKKPYSPPKLVELGHIGEMSSLERILEEAKAKFERPVADEELEKSERAEQTPLGKGTDF